MNPDHEDRRHERRDVDVLLEHDLLLAAGDAVSAAQTARLALAQDPDDTTIKRLVDEAKSASDLQRAKRLTDKADADAVANNHVSAAHGYQ